MTKLELIRRAKAIAAERGLKHGYALLVAEERELTDYERDMAAGYDEPNRSDFDGWRMTNHDGRGGDE